MKNRIRFAFILITVSTGLLLGCSSTYEIEGSYPTPLVTPLPVQLDLELDDAFRTYIYNEEKTERSKVSVSLGEAQANLFETITGSMFSGDENAPLLKMTPAIEDFQYAIPRETRAEIYEVWLKYRITIEQSDGTTLADWLLTGYGKTPSAFMKTQSSAINAAANVALRDIGTQIAIGLPRQPDISLWLSDVSAQQGQPREAVEPLGANAP